MLKQFYRSEGAWGKNQGMNKQKGTFQQTFSHSIYLNYCSVTPDCKNDGLQHDVNGKIPDPPSSPAKSPAEHVSYRLRGGEIVTVPEEFEIGHRVLLPREHNSTLVAMQVEAHEYDADMGSEQFDYIADNMYWEEDFVDEHLSTQDLFD